MGSAGGAWIEEVSRHAETSTPTITRTAAPSQETTDVKESRDLAGGVFLLFALAFAVDGPARRHETTIDEAVFASCL